MKYLRRWNLPLHDDLIVEHLDKPPGWGVSLFFYCHKCRSIYANVQILPEDCTNRIWQGISGLCLTCPPDRWHIRGTLETIQLVGWNVPYEVVMYQLDREIDFIGHPEHPHYKECVSDL